MLRRIIDGAKKVAVDVVTVAKKILSIPLSVIKILLLPVTLTYTVLKYIVKILFLPVTIGWNILKMVFYPVQLVLRKLFSPDPPPPKFVYGVPTGAHMFGPPIFTS